MEMIKTYWAQILFVGFVVATAATGQMQLQNLEGEVAELEGLLSRKAFAEFEAWKTGVNFRLDALER
jgi:hypothetical protein